jgi:lysozyme
MKFTIAARALLQHLEGLRLFSYQDRGGRWTIGYGHCGPEVHHDLLWTEAQAEAALDADIAIHATAVQHRLAHVPHPLSDEEFSALVIFCFNIGVAAFVGSSLARHVVLGDMQAVPGELMRWIYVHVDGLPVVDPVLVNRRKAEIALWDSGLSPQQEVG